MTRLYDEERYVSDEEVQAAIIKSMLDMAKEFPYLVYLNRLVVPLLHLQGSTVGDIAVLMSLRLGILVYPAGGKGGLSVNIPPKEDFIGLLRVKYPDILRSVKEPPLDKQIIEVY